VVLNSSVPTNLTELRPSVPETDECNLGTSMTGVTWHNPHTTNEPTQIRKPPLFFFLFPFSSLHHKSKLMLPPYTAHRTDAAPDAGQPGRCPAVPHDPTPAALPHRTLVARACHPRHRCPLPPRVGPQVDIVEEEDI
jgi:hypothetical protein